MTTDTPVPLILCFGDSLTAGYHTPSPSNPSPADAPYGHVLQERLGPRGQVELSAVCGEVTGEMLLRFRASVLDRRPRVVIILGGTNDLGWHADPAEIMRNLLKMYELARANAIVPVPVTVPSIRIELGEGNPEAASWLAQHIHHRQALNASIAEYAVTKGLRYLDLFTATAEPDSLMLAQPYSNDGLHLTTAGYRLFGQLAYERLFADDPGLLGPSVPGPAHP
ncbi:MAG: hypothetical protein JSR62_12370 [Nitrospira sp.]|nr:hypothetical protein [Nitrospira sp.]